MHSESIVIFYCVYITHQYIYIHFIYLVEQNSQVPCTLHQIVCSQGTWGANLGCVGVGHVVNLPCFKVVWNHSLIVTTFPRFWRELEKECAVFSQHPCAFFYWKTLSFYAAMSEWHTARGFIEQEGVEALFLVLDSFYQSTYLFSFGSFSSNLFIIL